MFNRRDQSNRAGAATTSGTATGTATASTGKPSAGQLVRANRGEWEDSRRPPHGGQELLCTRIAQPGANNRQGGIYFVAPAGEPRNGQREILMI